MATHKWNTIKDRRMSPEVITQVREEAHRELLSLNLRELREPGDLEKVTKEKP